MGRFKSFLSTRRAGGITAMGVAGAAVDSTLTYQFDQMENPNHSQAYSMAKGVATGAAWLFAEPLMWGITLGSLAKDGVGAMYQDAREQEQLANKIKLQTTKDATGAYHGTLGGNFVDSQNAYTMRQRQMDLLRRHKMSTETVLGSEARQLHR